MPLTLLRDFPMRRRKKKVPPMEEVSRQQSGERGPILIGLISGLAIALIWSYGDLRLGQIPMAPLAGLAAAFLVYTVVSHMQAKTRYRAFSQFFDASPDQTFLVDRRGAILCSNRAAGHVDGALVAILSEGVEDAEQVIYQLGRTAIQNGQAEQTVNWSGMPCQFRVRRAGAGSLIWQIAPLPVVADVSSSADDVGEAVSGTLPEIEVLNSPHDLLDKLPVGLARISGNGVIRYLNSAARALLGAEAQPGSHVTDLIDGLGQPIPERLRETLAGRAQGRSEVARGERDGAEVFLQVTLIRVFEGDEPVVLAVLADATELKTLEAQFVQSQKMQAVGQLAGGIAHDFNNLLTAIHGHCDLLLLRHDYGDPDHGDLIQIRQNANRAAALVRQLLAFSRKQTLRLSVLHLYDTMAELAHLLNRLLGEKVQLKIENAEDIWPVRVDERQLEQVVVNLVVNARDAMPDGGVVRLRTRNLELNEELHRDRATVPAGRYCVIEVHDTGVGIPPKQLNKVFEPFYTTKRVGEGTGLGLSTAYGIIKQTGGFIFVDSEIGKGTHFSIFLPVYEGEVESTSGDGSLGSDGGRVARDLTGRGVVLLVEDEAPVRSFAARALRMRGYQVLEADCGEAALELVEDDTKEIDLFVSDVIMPGLDGPSWVRRALEVRPQISTIFVSGYAEDAFELGDEPIPRSTFLAKPFSLNDLTTRVRDHMDRYVQDADERTS